LDGNCYVFVGNGTAASIFVNTADMGGIDNVFRDIETSSGFNRGPSNGFAFMASWNNTADDGNVVDNVEVKDYFRYGIRAQNMVTSALNCKIHNTGNTRTGLRWGIDISLPQYTGGATIANNMIYNLGGTQSQTNLARRKNTSSTYGIMIRGNYSDEPVRIYNNVVDIATNGFTYGIYCYSFGSNANWDIDHNTILMINPENDRGHTSTVYMIYTGYTNGNVRNNLFYSNYDNTGGNFYVQYGFHDATWGGPSQFRNNCMYIEDVTGNMIRYGYNNNPFSQLEEWSDWTNSTWARGGDFNHVHPRIVDADAQNYNFGGVGMSKRGIPISHVSRDINGDARDASRPQVGALESFVDYAITDLDFTTDPTECSNFEKSITFTIANNNSFTARGIPVTYDINGGPKIVEIFPDPIDANDEATYTFSDPHLFNGDGVTTVNVYIDGDDEVPGNNRQSYTFNLEATPSGVVLTEGNIFPGYYRGGNVGNPDVTVPNAEVEYDLSAPTKYNLSGYNSDWTITNETETLSGTSVGASEGLTIDGGNGALAFDPVSSLEGETVRFQLLITDRNTGCDSTIMRHLYVPHTPRIDFEANNVCLGTVAQFNNLSTMGGSNIMLNKWRFNDPLAAEDTSEITDGFHEYTTAGDKTVELEVVNQAYPKFVYSLSKSITVTPVPTIDFRVINECEGTPIGITNNTSLPAGVSGTITYEWDFGDGSSPKTGSEPTHLYAESGGYLVTLSATANGCTSEQTKNANQFPMPSTDFTASSVCANEPIEIENNTSIVVGNIGFMWDFGDGGISTARNPNYVFGSAGLKTIKMTAISEFGCEREQTRTVDIKEAPRADFNFDRACNLTPVNFTNIGVNPSSGDVTYEWDFNGEGASTVQNPEFLFSEVGSKQVTFRITGENACTDAITKQLNVVLQAVADFEVSNVCQGEDAIFTNKSTVSAGNLTYLWDFGNGQTSTQLSPRTNYGTTFGTISVTLTANVDGGCDDQVVKQIAIEKAPSSEFDVIKKEGRNFVAEAVEDNLTYRWRMGDGARYETREIDHFYQVDNGEFLVCLSTRNDANCWSVDDEENCQLAFIDLAGVENLEANNDMMNVYPNPTTGRFTVSIDNVQDNVEIVVADILGNILSVEVIDNMNGKYDVNMGSVAAGVYLVQVKNGSSYATKKITVNK
jgi:PKD repeat protein